MESRGGSARFRACSGPDVALGGLGMKDSPPCRSAKVVVSMGGFNNVTQEKQWAEVATQLQLRQVRRSEGATALARDRLCWDELCC